MLRWLRKIEPRQEPPGAETALLRRMPVILVAGSLAPLVVHALAGTWVDDGAASKKALLSIDIFLIAAVVTFWTAVFTVTIGCIIVAIMKGPAYVADAYPVQDAKRPAAPRRTRV